MKMNMNAIVHIDSPEAFDKALEEFPAVMVDFWAPWCGPCKQIEPMIDDLLKKKQFKPLTVLKVNVDEQPSLAQRFSVRGIPSLLLFAKEVLIGRQTGVVSQEKLEAFVSQALSDD